MCHSLTTRYEVLTHSLKGDARKLCYEHIPDYNDLHALYETEQEQRLKKHPKCAECGERITDDFLFCIYGVLFHEECAKDNFRKHTEDYTHD